MSHLKTLNDRSRGKQSTSFPEAEPSETLRCKGNIISSINPLLSPPGGSFISKHILRVDLIETGAYFIKQRPS